MTSLGNGLIITGVIAGVVLTLIGGELWITGKTTEKTIGGTLMCTCGMLLLVTSVVIAMVYGG